MYPNWAPMHGKGQQRQILPNRVIEEWYHERDIAILPGNICWRTIQPCNHCGFEIFEQRVWGITLIIIKRDCCQVVTLPLQSVVTGCCWGGQDRPEGRRTFHRNVKVSNYSRFHSSFVQVLFAERQRLKLRLKNLQICIMESDLMT